MLSDASAVCAPEMAGQSRARPFARRSCGSSAIAALVLNTDPHIGTDKAVPGSGVPGLGFRRTAAWVPTTRHSPA
eukprot:1579436-Rhodomonas_salina.1